MSTEAGRQLSQHLVPAHASRSISVRTRRPWLVQLLARRTTEAEAEERRVQAEVTEQFKRLKDEAQAIYGLTRGRPGVRTPQQWAELLEKAGDELGNGSFIGRCHGAERYLEPEFVAVLVTLRQNLMAELPRVTAADIMMIDAAIISYYNFLRTPRWIGNLSLVVERELFGQAAERNSRRQGGRSARGTAPAWRKSCCRSRIARAA